MHTVRAAYRMMESGGLVTTRQGRGTHVLSFDHLRQVQQAPKLPTFTIGVLIPGYNPFYTPFLRGIEEVAEARPALLLIGHTRDDEQRARRYLDQMAAKNVDGLIIASKRDVGEDQESGHIPIVYADIPDAPGPLVVLDSEAAGYKATDHLIKHGHKRIGLITCPIEWSNVRQVYAGFHKALETAGLAQEAEISVTVHEFSIDAGYLGAMQLLDEGNPPGAIYAINDLLAIGAMKAIQERGLRVPEDIVVAGYNDIEMAALVDPPLTTVSVSAYDMGVQSMRMLERVMDDGSVQPEVLTLETELIVC